MRIAIRWRVSAVAVSVVAVVIAAGILAAPVAASVTLARFPSCAAGQGAVTCSVTGPESWTLATIPAVCIAIGWVAGVVAVRRSD